MNNTRPQLFCQCPEKCGVEGVWRSQATYYRHNPKESPLTLKTTTSTSVTTTSMSATTTSTSATTTSASLQNPRALLAPEGIDDENSDNESDSHMDIDPPGYTDSLIDSGADSQTSAANLDSTNAPMILSEPPNEPRDLAHAHQPQQPTFLNFNSGALDEDDNMPPRPPSPTDHPLAGASHYYPAHLKPDQYFVAGCDHDDVSLGELLDSFDPEEAVKRYQANVQLVCSSENKRQYEKNRLDTGISKPTIFSGLSPEHMLGVPDCFGLDVMHAPSLNITDLLPALWCGTFDHDKITDSKDTWDWVVLTGDIWKRHGKAVADLTPYIPGSFDRPPRNPAEKINSGYKAWEWLLYFYGAGPALLYGILPTKYYINYCKVVRSIRILLQEEISPEELLESHQCYSEFSDEFEELYVQRRADRIHFVRPVIHTISHMPGETVRKGPGNIYSQWALERTIGNLGEEIKQHSNPYANLLQRAIRRCQVNALKAVIPDLEPETDKLPRLCGFGGWLHKFGDEIAEEWQPSVVKWARARLPNGQVVRSWWKEEFKTQLRSAQHVKSIQIQIQTPNSDPEFAEVLFFMILHVDDEERHLAVVSFFGPPDPHLLGILSKTYWSVKRLREADVRAIDVTSIASCVMMAPDMQYEHYRRDGSEIDRWFMMEKPGLKLASWTAASDSMEED
ncbi:hypothetical protein B0H19DRAFT_1302248 [Mycena capillaripes]|nr:hypothetical protein B0H19DRAFT_1302248 [Mycena capillaripes]